MEYIYDCFNFRNLYVFVFFLLLGLYWLVVCVGFNQQYWHFGILSSGMAFKQSAHHSFKSFIKVEIAIMTGYLRVI